MGQALGKSLTGPALIALISDLGGGKTTLTQGIARGLGIKERVISPTFVLEKIYEIPKREMSLHHYDLYRIDPDDVMVDEILANAKDSIVVVEWAEKMEDQLPIGTQRIDISVGGNEQRTIKITSH